MLSIKSLVESLGVFERNKVPLELKILGLAFYIQLSSLRRAARALSEIHNNKTIHTILQPPKEVKLSCHVQEPNRKIN